MLERETFRHFGGRFPDWKLRLLRRFIRLMPRGRNIVIARWAQRNRALPAVVCTTAYGFQMVVDLREFLARDIFFNGVYEPVTAAVIDHFLETGDTFVDVGANQGQFTLLAAKRVGETGAVYAFEPNTIVRELLECSVVLNGFSNVHVHASACMDAPGEFTFELGSTPGNAFGAGRVSGPASANSETIKGLRLDDFVAETNLHQIALLKMDIEGAEGKALAGLAQTLKRRTVKRLIVEFHPESGLPGGHAAVNETTTRIAESGYALRQVHEYPIGFFGHYKCDFSQELLYKPGSSGSGRELANPQYLFERIEV